jgi:hypothetical protein
MATAEAALTMGTTTDVIQLRTGENLRHVIRRILVKENSIDLEVATAHSSHRRGELQGGRPFRRARRTASTLCGCTTSIADTTDTTGKRRNHIVGPHDGVPTRLIGGRITRLAWLLQIYGPRLMPAGYPRAGDPGTVPAFGKRLGLRHPQA